MTLARVEQAHRRLLTASERQQEARERLRKTVLEARENHTLESIGQVLGITKQGVQAMLKDKR